jgi:hypothetical protein
MTSIESVAAIAIANAEDIDVPGAPGIDFYLRMQPLELGHH